MSVPLRIRPEFQDDLKLAVMEYENRLPGLGKRFRAEVIRHLDKLHDFPESRRVVLDTIRRDLIRRYDFWILFSIEPDHIHVLGLVYAGQNLDEWMLKRFGRT